MKTKTTIIILTILLGVLTINYFRLETKSSDVQLTKEEKQEIAHEEKVESKAKDIDIVSEQMKYDTMNTDRMIEQLNSEIEFVLLEETGSFKLTHNKDADKNGFEKFFSHSGIEVNAKYKAIYTIPTKELVIENINGAICISYVKESIKVKSIEFTEIVPLYDRAFFGKKYTNEELLALMNNVKEDLYEKLNNDTENIELCSGELDSFLKGLAEKCNVNNVNINGQNDSIGYQFIRKNDLEYNNPNELLDSVDYIVIHSTGVKNVNSDTIYGNFNRENERVASAHFIVDDKQIIQDLGVNKVAWAVGKATTAKIPCYNSNSISLEICEFDDIEQQQKAIKNAQDFVKNVLQPQFPNAQIVCHRMIQATACPSILSDDEFNSLFLN